MAVTKGWLDRTGTKICVEDIYQMQLMYEEPDSSHGPLVGTRSLYLSDKGSLYQCVEYYDAEKTNERYPAGVEIALNAEDMEKLRAGDRTVENYKKCLSELQKTTIWSYLSDPKQFRTVHRETNKVSDYAEITIKFGKGCMKEFEKAGADGEPEKFAEIRFKDGGTWKTFVVPRKYVHENQFGKGLWLKRNSSGKTKVTTYNAETKEKTEEWVPNQDLKKKVESYKQKKKAR